MTDFRTHWMRTVHDALCGLSAKRLPRGERIIGGECATADVTCLGCRAVLRLAAMDEATSDTDLRTLAQAVWRSTSALSDAFKDGHPGGDVPLSAEQEKALATYRADRAALAAVSYDAILAALDAAEAQGYARAMREVAERADHGADYTGWSDYALGHRDAHERLAVWARERLPAAAERD